MPFFKSAASLRSDSSDLDLEGLAESELARLQRQFRLLEGDRHAYSLQSRETIRRQMAEVRRLEKENEELQRRQTVASGRLNRQREKSQADSLRTMLEKRDEVEQQIAEVKKQLAQLDKEIRTWKKRVDDRKQVVGSETLLQQQRAHLQHRIQTMENQLDRVSSEFSSQLVENAQLREDLEVLQIGHDHFDQLYKHLDQELMTARQAIGAIIRSSSAAYDARDEAQARLGQLQDKAAKDLAQYEQETKELYRILDHDRQMSDFITIKLQERALTEEALKAKEKHEQEHRRRDPEEELVDSYNRAFKQILELPGMTSLDVAVNNYITAEERNFAQFNYVNEQNNQKELLWEQINEIYHEIQEVRELGDQKKMELRLRLKDTEMQQEQTVNEAKLIELQLKSTCKVLEQLKSAIESLFRKLQCDRSALEKLLGGTTAARDENVPIYLGLIEKKTNELLAMYSFLSAEENNRPYDTLETVQLLLGQQPEIPSHPHHIRPPTTGISHESIAEEDQRPLSHTELREKVLKDVLSKAEAHSFKKSGNMNKK
ncbi:outer dynein arm-docking complex subunit 1 [Tiliqua scincoides]|uniref:outer dynein arm-docking complex subunit 1 n=1 Tax=Tiliqua scincoides TaxID=71010 RepID=UPI0034634FA4